MILEIGTCGITAEEVIHALETEPTCILATCACNQVSVRPMSHVSDGVTVFFQTGKDYLKTRQIRANPNVALCVGTYQIEGTAVETGHPLAEGNELFARLIKAKHPDAYAHWSALEDEVVIKVTVGRVRQWRYVEGQPVLAEAEF